ncbi:DUF1266 domain-containing protein [Ureaplasma urealyticum]|uniref:DUF1266 domain-containing protein n=3 Tax=Ureaplasma urealyticum TaxID=2130 RepID=A0AAP9D7K9_UREUR|nr:DUF1266 domain-containing protein [Ureaplasma urealyticum]EDX53986.1 conserved hypothetical protein [Ureaplasma urealyticum serovar 9 str. ATCC 33175]ACI60279.1 conserved hypothetical protein [Ureaplasma urealyticum serovar 10 str. ATCC 33699]EDT49759.1 conserved hypothetical protein [Ureaplasma urealyticum serovar 13 str. ATCC 33698]EDU06068.1 conserved hypothetical protein [Ureaplasma urealyticum serovar 5 str. ATCC 27817]EDU56823.1 conserved hypothetical protein [Ureaplasma urealyticum s
MINKKKIINPNIAYFEQNIPNYQEHLVVWNDLYDKLILLTDKIIVDKNNKSIYQQTDKQTLDFSLCLSGLLSKTLGLNHKSSSLYLTSDDELAHRFKIKVLHNYFNLYNIEEFYAFMDNQIRLENAKNIARLSLIYDLKKHENILKNTTDTDLENIDLEFAFINFLRAKISINFAYAYDICETILLLRTGHDLRFLENEHFSNLIPVFGLQVIKYFSNWKEFLINYVMAVAYHNLDINNPQNVFLATQKFIDHLDELIVDYGLNKRDQWIKKIIPYEE